MSRLFFGIFVVVLLAPLLLAGPGRQITPAGAGGTVSSGIDGEALSGSPETDAIRISSQGIYSQAVLLVSISAGTTTSVSATATHSTNETTYHQLPDCEYQGTGAYECPSTTANPGRVDHYTITSGTATHLQYWVPAAGAYMKAKFEGNGNSTITVHGIMYMP